MVANNKETRRNERGDGLIVYLILLMPLLVLVMGIAVDSNAANSTKSAIQASADMASQGTLSQSPAAASGSPHYTDAATAKARFIQYYNSSSVSINGTSGNNGVQNHLPFLRCSTSDDVDKSKGEELVNRTLPDGSNCPWVLKEFKYTQTNKNVSIATTVQEKNRTVILGMLNRKFNTMNYVISSNARLTYTVEQ